MLYRETGARQSQDLVGLALLALVLRVAYLLAGLSTQNLAGVAMVAPDSQVYVQLAEYLRGGQAEPVGKLLVAGPGYPALLAVLSMLFGPGLWPPVALNILLAALAPMAVYLLALALLNDRTVALVSGLLVTFSFTGVSLSTSVLTDQPFYTLHSFALLTFVWGLKSDRIRWFVWAGLLAGMATCIRSIGQLWPAVFMGLAILHLFCGKGARKPRRVFRSLWTPAIMLAFILSWSAWNQARHGIFTFTTNGVRASWAFLAATAVADHTPGASFDSVRAAWWDEAYRPVGEREPSEAETYDRMRTRLLEVLRQHPDWLASAFATTVWRNVRAPNHFAEAQVPRWSAYWERLRNVCHDYVNPVILLVTLSALGILAAQRQWESLLVLGGTYTMFTLTTGFSFWQGSRLHYPAEMAWSILVSYLGVQVWRRARKGGPAPQPPAGFAATRRRV